MPTLLDRAGRFALDLLYPPRCSLCGAHGALLCDMCASLLPLTEGVRCEQCWVPVEAAGVCGHCFKTPPSFVSIRSAYVMEREARTLAHQLKYEDLTSLAAPMGRLMAGVADVRGIDVVVPVPLHRGRERSRGYNQSRELARHVAAVHALAIDTRALRRVRDTAPLAKTMHRDERRVIVAGAFRAAPERCEDRRILLIDDVVTTGATLDACAAALLDAGAASVRCLTWARAD